MNSLTELLLNCFPLELSSSASSTLPQELFEALIASVTFNTGHELWHPDYTFMRLFRKKAPLYGRFQ